MKYCVITFFEIDLSGSVNTNISLKKASISASTKTTTPLGSLKLPLGVDGKESADAPRLTIPTEANPPQRRHVAYYCPGLYEPDDIACGFNVVKPHSHVA